MKLRMTVTFLSSKNGRCQLNFRTLKQQMGRNDSQRSAGGKGMGKFNLNSIFLGMGISTFNIFYYIPSYYFIFFFLYYYSLSSDSLSLQPSHTNISHQ